MNIASTIGRTAAVLATLGALAALAGGAQAGKSRSPGLGSQSSVSQRMTAAEYGALTLRSEGLNQKYGLGPQISVSQRMSAAEYGALMLRSEALNQKYGLGN